MVKLIKAYVARVQPTILARLGFDGEWVRGR